MSSEGTILHADLDAFYASVEQRDDPALRGRPVIVGGGVVLAASYEAKRLGVRTATSLRVALARAPRAIVVPPRMAAYTEASRAVFDVFADTTPLVEPLSVDEAFLDVGGLSRIRGGPSSIAADLRAAVARRVGLPITVGVARTKFLAKVASAVGKPDGLLVVPLDGELAFLHPLPVERLWGVGPVTAAALHTERIRTVAQVAQRTEGELVSLLGAATGRHLHALAHGRDPRPIEVGRRRRSVGAQHAVGRSDPSASDLEALLSGLVDRVCRRLRASDRTGRTVTLRLRFADYTKASRSHTVSTPTAHTGQVLTVARDLLHRAQPEIDQRGATLIGVAVSGLDDNPAQLELPWGTTSGSELDIAVDDIRERFGSGSLTRAGLVGRGLSPSVPLLPD